MPENRCISVITPSFNREKLIGKAIQSVLNQDYSCIEHVIIDGRSTDNTLEVLKRYPHLKVFCEIDDGLYDALNKGLNIVSGHIVCFLNTDDYFIDNTFSTVMEIFNENASLDAVVTNAKIIIQSHYDFTERISEIKPLRAQPLWNLLGGIPAFNAWFFRKEVFERIGGFDTNLKFAADKDFLIRFYLEGLQYGFLDEVVYCYRSHPGSLTFNEKKINELQIRQEDLQIAEKYLKLNYLSRKQRYYFRKWHTYNSVELARQFFKAREINYALKISQKGIAENPLWPFAFLRRNLHVLINKVMGKKE